MALSFYSPDSPTEHILHILHFNAIANMKDLNVNVKLLFYFHNLTLGPLHPHLYGILLHQ